MKIIKLGVIGLGYIGQVHFSNCLKLPNAQVFAVADTSSKALKMAKTKGIKNAYSNYETLLKIPNIDAVIIALPTHLHAECVKKAAEAGKHIFLEKPIARSVKEAQEIISVTQRNSVKLMIGYPYRFNHQFLKIKYNILNGLLGDIENAHLTFVTTGPFFHRAESHTPVRVPDWWFKKELTGGGALFDLGSHMINLLRWLFGEVTDIKSYLGYRFNLDFEDSAMCLCKFDSGTVAVMNVGWFSQGFSLKIDLMGSVGSLHDQYLPNETISSRIRKMVTGYTKSNQMHLGEIEYFLKCLIRDETPILSGRDGLKDLEAINLAYKNQIDLI